MVRIRVTLHSFTNKFKHNNNLHIYPTHNYPSFSSELYDETALAQQHDNHATFIYTKKFPQAHTNITTTSTYTRHTITYHIKTVSVYPHFFAELLNAHKKVALTLAHGTHTSDLAQHSFTQAHRNKHNPNNNLHIYPAPQLQHAYPHFFAELLNAHNKVAITLALAQQHGPHTSYLAEYGAAIVGATVLKKKKD